MKKKAESCFDFDEVLSLVEGLDVLDSEKFGSYQGDFWCLVAYEGQRFFLHYEYGSCGVCDVISGIREDVQFDEYLNLEDRFVDWAKEQLTHRYTYDEAVQKASENLDWDLDAQEMVEWLKSKKI